MMHPPPSHGRIKYPLGNISALTKDWTGGIVGPFCFPVSDRSQICATNLCWSSNETADKSRYKNPNRRRSVIHNYNVAREHNKHAIVKQLTTKFPSSRIVVYLSVQKSRAGAKVVGAYICHFVSNLAALGQSISHVSR